MKQKSEEKKHLRTQLEEAAEEHISTDKARANMQPLKLFDQAKLKEIMIIESN